MRWLFKKGLHLGIAIAGQLLLRSFGVIDAINENNDPVGNDTGTVHIVGNDDRGRLLLGLNTQNELNNFFGRDRVQATGRFVVKTVA